MHDTAALILEAVMNSIEAGASSISVRIAVENGSVSVITEDDGSMDDLFSALLPLFNLDKAMTVSIKRSSGEIVVSHAELEKRGAVPVSAQGIKAFRTFVNGLEKGENYG